jgi:hypothetical protein
MKRSKNSVKRSGKAIGLALILGALATAGHAGEITGNGKSLKDENDELNGKSECAFSGLNDDFSGDPTAPGDAGMRTQNWGQIPKAFRDFLRSVGVSPDNQCNPSRVGGDSE